MQIGDSHGVATAEQNLLELCQVAAKPDSSPLTENDDVAIVPDSSDDDAAGAYMADAVDTDNWSLATVVRHILTSRQVAHLFSRVLIT